MDSTFPLQGLSWPDDDDDDNDQSEQQWRHQHRHQHQHQHQGLERHRQRRHQDGSRQDWGQEQQHPLTSNLLRPRQGSLASDWAFPSMQSQHRHFVSQGPLSPGLWPQPFDPKSSPNLRQPRGRQHTRQNTDPLVNHRLISSDPVNCTRTLSPNNLGPFSPSASPTTAGHFDHVAPLSPASPPPRIQHDADETFASQALVDPPCNASSHRAPLPLDGSRSDRYYFPITPVSPAVAGPRWDSLPSPSRGPNSLAVPAAIGIAKTANAPIVPEPTYPPSPLRSPKSPTFSNSLYSQPFIPENQALDFTTEATEFSRYDHAVPVTTDPADSATMYRPDSRQSQDTAYSLDVHNFSNPQKQSLRRPEFPGGLPLRPSTARSAQSDSLRLESRTMTTAGSPNTNYAPYYVPYNSAPRRQPSAASNMSASTFTSVTPSLQHKPSQDHLGVHRNVSQNAATGYQAGLPHTILPQAPPRYHNRGPLALNQQSHHAYEDGMRASMRSQLTASTGQETLFTEPERTSVMTKSSSVVSSNFTNTRQSSFFGPHTPTLDVRDSLSVDDVMGMYVDGFNDSDMDLARRMSGIEPERNEIPVVRLNPGRTCDQDDDSRPSSAVSRNSEAANRLLEAMNEPSPVEIPGRSFPLNGDGTVVLRDTNAYFRKSLASSLPKDMRLSFISTTSRMDQRDDVDGADDAGVDTDSTRHSRHDSGKMIDPHGDASSVEDMEKADEPLRAPVEPPVPSQGNDGTLSPRSISSEKPLPPPAPSVPIQGAAQPEDLDPDANDRYGFRKSNQYVTREQYDQWNGQYSEYLARRRKKWEAYLKENGLMTDQPNRFPQHSAKAKRFVRKGIPPEWRGAAWFYYAGGPKILANNQGVYDQLVKRSASGQLKDVCRDDIERDLYRTFPDNVRFRRSAVNPPPGSSPEQMLAHSRNNSTQSANPLPRAPGSEPEIIAQLRRVLSAFAIFNPAIGYCQSLNFLGGMLLLFVESEEQAFWLLNIITRVYLPGTHEMSLEGSKVDLSVLMQELQDVLPNVWAKISDDGSGSGAAKKKPRRPRKGAASTISGENLPPVTLALTAWFMSCFIGTLPMETTLRVWDVFFYEGSKTLFRVALAIFKAGENEIKAINDPMEVFAVVQSLPRKMLDANLFMEIAFKKRSGLNHLTAEVIDERRAERKEQLSVERKEAVAAAAGNPGIQAAATIAVSSRTRNTSDLLSADAGDIAMRRKHTLFGRNKPPKAPGLAEV